MYTSPKLVVDGDGISGSDDFDRLVISRPILLAQSQGRGISTGELPARGVTSTGGTTEAALRALEAADLRATVRAALNAATQRGRELAMHTR